MSTLIPCHLYSEGRVYHRMLPLRLFADDRIVEVWTEDVWEVDELSSHGQDKIGLAVSHVT